MQPSSLPTLQDYPLVYLIYVSVDESCSFQKSSCPKISIVDCLLQIAQNVLSYLHVSNLSEVATSNLTWSKILLCICAIDHRMSFPFS
jgi:hypothetical protein